MFSLRRWTAPLALSSALVVGLACPAWAVPVTVWHTNDTHDHLEEFNSRHAPNVGGAARRATLFQRARREDPTPFFFDAGDVFQGTPLFTFFSGEADYRVMAALGYDAIAVGNHDLDNGLPNLLAQARHLPTPPLCCNLRVEGQAAPPFPGVRRLERNGVKVAVVGVMSHNAFEAVAADRRRGLRLLDPEETLAAEVAKLRPLVDLIVVVSHSGLEEERAYAKRVPGIDLVVGGHSHTRVERPEAYPNPDGRTTLVVQAFQWGEVVGRLDLEVEGGRLTRWAGALLPVATTIPEDPAVKALVEGYAAQVRTQMSRVVGHAEVSFPNERKAWGDAPIGNLVSDALRWYANTDVAIMNSGGIRASIDQGPITMGEVYSMLPFENKVARFPAPAWLVQELADFTASKLGQSGSLQVSGLSFLAKGGKATDLRIGGQPLDARRMYTVSTIDYLASGNDGATVFNRARHLEVPEVLVRDAFLAYLANHPRLGLPQGGRIRNGDPIPAAR